jgi:hypothetical protein
MYPATIMRTILSFVLFCLFGVLLSAQEPSAQPVFAPGGLIVIPPDIDYESVANRTDMTEVLAVLSDAEKLDPALKNTEARFNPEVWATSIRTRRDVWCLEFAFKRVRIVDVDIPNAKGNFDRKKVWYLVYRVKNLGPAKLDEKQINSILGSGVPPGNEMSLPVPSDVTTLDLPRSAAQEFRQQTGVFAPQPGAGEPIRFVPQFILAVPRLVLGAESAVNPDTGQTEWKEDTVAVIYLDSIIPLALLKIKEREKMEIMPQTTASIAQNEIAPGQELWGVAMWTDVDPRINEFSIYVAGLTNAYMWLNENEEGQYVVSGKIDETTGKFNEKYVNTGKVGEGRVIKQRVLKTDWWRVGDKDSLNETQIHFGSKDGKMVESILDKTGRMTPEERKKFDAAAKKADKNQDDWVSPVEKAIYHLIQQDWLKPGFGYEWLFL